MLNIVIPMAGQGSRFQTAGYAFPKPLIDIRGKTMIDVVIRNLKPNLFPHRFIFICQKELYDTYDVHNVLKQSTDNNFDVIKLHGITQGAACTVLAAIGLINNDDELLIANCDQFLQTDMHAFLASARQGEKDGYIMTFKASHPKWSYALADQSGLVHEVAEKRVISDKATVGIYYFKKGRDFVECAQSMIEKNIRHNNEFYVCPVFNEMIIRGKRIFVHDIESEHMHGLGTPEDLNLFLQKLENGSVMI